jgi:hypothetical protein
MKKFKKVILLSSAILALGLTTGLTAFAAGNGGSFEEKKAILNEKVASGEITADTADKVVKELEVNKETCNGDGVAAIGKKYNVGFGKGKNKQGSGRMQGQRNQNKTCDGSCLEG